MAMVTLIAVDIALNSSLEYDDMGMGSASSGRGAHVALLLG